MNTTDRYSERIRYDKNSNVSNVARYGMNNLRSYGVIDSLEITRNGNQLVAIEDHAEKDLTYTGASDFVDGTDLSEEYTYDGNGRLTKDTNRGIGSITYDPCNNPQSITFTGTNGIEYAYASDGTKLRTVHKVSGIGGSVTRDTTDYLGNLLMRNGHLDMYQFDGGYVSFSNDTIDGWHYYIQDYMGNNRMVVNSDGTIEQVTHYYPYGGVIGDISTNENLQKYKFEGKELDRTFGLDNYDIHARQYFAMMPSWDRIDPMAEKYYGISPYAYCGGNPVNLGDYNGMDTLYFRINKDKVTANYTSRTLCEGDNVGIIKDDGGNTLHQFSFAHQDDAKHFFVNQEDYLDYCENNNINPNGFHMLDKVCLMSNEDVSSFISPIPSMDGGPQAWIYAWKESRGENKTMDIMFQINKRFQGEENLYIPYEDGSHIFNADGLVAHDKFNFGNYLWGIAIHKLGISYPIGVLGAHIDNMIHHWGALDSNDDQYSIRLGYFLGHR